MVAQLAGVLGMEGGIGTSYEVGADGRYTGKLNGPFVYGEGKVEAMQRFAYEHGIDLDESYAYSDSVSDLPMLRSVGNAVVVNPDEPLLEVAKAEGWIVMRFERLGRKLADRGAPPSSPRRWPDPVEPCGRAAARRAASGHAKPLSAIRRAWTESMSREPAA